VQKEPDCGFINTALDSKSISNSLQRFKDSDEKPFRAYLSVDTSASTKELGDFGTKAKHLSLCFIVLGDLQGKT